MNIFWKKNSVFFLMSSGVDFYKNIVIINKEVGNFLIII